MSETEEYKAAVCAYVNAIKEELGNVSRYIFENPELSFAEYKAARLLAEKLEKASFCVEMGVAGLATAIRAVHPARNPGPKVAIIAEYDALPEVGHACGHNLIAAAALGASLALGRIKKDLPGTLVFFGTPGEESVGGKVTIVNAGLFDDIDAAMMFHPSHYTAVDIGSLAINEIRIEFFGKASHSAGSPEKGVNALDTVIQTFNAINALRQHIKDGARIHGVVTDGGLRPNIVPEHAAAYFYVRAASETYCVELVQKLRRCAEGAALATGATLSFEVVPSNKPMKPNRALGEACARALKELGISLTPPSPEAGMGSTDMGDVSQVAPAIELEIQICGPDIPFHSRGFAEVAGSAHAQEVMLTAAKALAMTAIDVFTDPELVGRMRQEFQADRGSHGSDTD